MKSDLTIALRNLLRNRRRSFATLVALVIGTASILLFGGFSTNIQYSMHTAYVRTGGHLQIQHRDYFLYGSGNPTAYGIPQYERLLDRIRADEQLASDLVVASPTLRFGGIAGNSRVSVSQTVLGMGSIAADVNRMRDWNLFGLPLVAERFALDGAGPDAAIVGIGVARVLQLCAELAVANCPRPEPEAPREGGTALPADIAALSNLEAGNAPSAGATGPPRIELLASTVGGTPNVVSLSILRAERQGFKELDEAALLLQFNQAQKLVYGRGTPEATSIMVQIRDSARLDAAAARLRELIQAHGAARPLAVLDFRELNPFFVQTVAMFDMIFGFIFALIGAIVVFTVSNAMNTAVVERTVEIGTVRSLGVRRRGVERLFLLEGAMLGAGGTLAGVALALLLAAAVNAVGLTWLPPGSGDRLPLLLIVWGEVGMIAGAAAGLMAIATLSAWWPARRASRLAIVDALRHV